MDWTPKMEQNFRNCRRYHQFEQKMARLLPEIEKKETKKLKRLQILRG